MRLLGVISGARLVALAKRARHTSKPKSLSKFQLSCCGNFQCYRSVRDLAVAVTDKVEVGVEVPGQVLDTVHLGPVPPPCDGAVAGEDVDADRRAVGPDEPPPDERVVAQVLQPKPEA